MSFFVRQIIFLKDLQFESISLTPLVPFTRLFIRTNGELNDESIGSIIRGSHRTRKANPNWHDWWWVLIFTVGSFIFQVNGSWSLPGFVCDFYIAMDVTCSTSSIFNLVAISIDRWASHFQKKGEGREAIPDSFLEIHSQRFVDRTLPIKPCFICATGGNRKRHRGIRDGWWTKRKGESIYESFSLDVIEKDGQRRRCNKRNSKPFHGIKYNGRPYCICFARLRQNYVAGIVEKAAKILKKGGAWFNRFTWHE